MLPCASQGVTITFMPAITAEAGFVPCAEEGISAMLRCESPREAWYARITIKPAYSPCAPELGCMDIAAKPVISHNHLLNSVIICWYPRVWNAGANGCILPNSGQVTGIISVVAFNFMVHDPKEIME